MDDDNEESFTLPRNYQPTGYVRIEESSQASMDVHIPDTNMGYRLLLRMGWKEGSGLGSELQGIFFFFPQELHRKISVII